ncbi:hypothetical protein R3I94_003937 [Phoxinus phoxinus]
MKSGRYIVNRVTEGTTEPQTESLWHEDEGKAPMCRGNRCLVLMTVCLGLICVLLLVFITLYITTTAERDLLKSYKNTINSSQDKNTGIITDKDQDFISFSQKKPEPKTRVNDFSAEKSQLQNNFNSLSQKKLELETRVNNLTAEKSLLQNNFNSLSQKKLQLETRVNNLTAEKSQLQDSFNSLSQKKLELETRVNDLTAEKSQLQDSFNSLNQKKLDLGTRVSDLTAEKSQLQNNFNSLSQKKLELETRVNNLTDEKTQLNQKKLELESNVTSLSEELKKEKSKQGDPRGPICLFKSTEPKSWSESRQYCRDHGGDLVIINTEEKQKHVTSFIKERVWIGLSIENKGIMKWVDNSTLNQRFWFEEEQNNAGRNEVCVELMPLDSVQNWNDLPCSAERKGICEK